jgi:hypothetical protein
MPRHRGTCTCGWTVGGPNNERSSGQPTLPASASARASHDEADRLRRPTSKDPLRPDHAAPRGAGSATERPAAHPGHRSPARPDRHHLAAPPGDRRTPAARQHRPAAHRPCCAAGLWLPAGLPCRPGDHPAVAKQQHRRRAPCAPGDGARPARPALAAPPAGDCPVISGDPAADRVLGGQTAGAPGRAGVRQRGGLPADAAGPVGRVAAAHARRTTGGPLITTVSGILGNYPSGEV